MPGKQCIMKSGTERCNGTTQWNKTDERQKMRSPGLLFLSQLDIFVAMVFVKLRLQNSGEIQLVLSSYSRCCETEKKESKKGSK